MGKVLVRLSRSQQVIEVNMICSGLKQEKN